MKVGDEVRIVTGRQRQHKSKDTYLIIKEWEHPQGFDIRRKDRPDHVGVFYEESQLEVLPKTLPEQLDAAQSGEEFGQILGGLFDSLARAKDEEDQE